MNGLNQVVCKAPSRCPECGKAREKELKAARYRAAKEKGKEEG